MIGKYGNQDPLARARQDALNRQTLFGFARAGLEHDYQAWRIALIRLSTSKALVMAAGMFTLFALKDVLDQPVWLAKVSLLAQFCVTVPVVMLTAWLTRSSEQLRYQIQLVAMWAVIVPAQVAVMAVSQARDHAVPYEVLLIMIVSLALFTGVRPIIAIGTSIYATGVYVGFLYAAGADPSALLPNTFYLLVTGMLATLGAHHLDTRDREQFLTENQLTEAAVTDTLTGLPNRRSAISTFATIWRLAHRNKSSLAVVYIDIDHFKRLNDTLGHGAGDDALTRVAAALRKSLDRPLDFVGRLGGEEFIVIAYGLDRTAAALLGEKLRKAVMQLAIYHPKSNYDQQLTVSVGVTTCEPQSPEPDEQIWVVADTALYQAKHGGRNRVQYADSSASS